MMDDFAQTSTESQFLGAALGALTGGGGGGGAKPAAAPPGLAQTQNSSGTAPINVIDNSKPAGGSGPQIPPQMMMPPMMPGMMPGMMPSPMYGYGMPPVIQVDKEGRIVNQAQSTAGKSTMALIQRILMLEQELEMLKKQKYDEEKSVKE